MYLFNPLTGQVDKDAIIDSSKETHQSPPDLTRRYLDITRDFLFIVFLTLVLVYLNRNPVAFRDSGKRTMTLHLECRL